jgi:uncharacterized phage protein gp47/JayE
MPVINPAIQTLANRIIADIESKINQSTPAMQKSYNRVLALVESGEFKALYNFLIDQKKQGFPQDAEEEFLTKWAELINEPREPESAALLTSGATGVNGTIIQSGSLGPVWIAPNGIIYSNTTTETITAGTATLTVQANVGGEIGNQEPGTELTLTSSVPGLDNKITVTAIASSGVNEQSIEEWRTEIILKYQKPPQGGAPSDYFFWATDRPNIIDAFPYSGDLPGEINLYIVASDQTDGIPTQAQLDDVEAYIREPGRLPLWARDLLPDGSTERFSVLASPLDEFDTIVTGLNPNVQSLRDAIENSINQYYGSRRPYIEGITTTRESELTKNELISIVQEQITLNNGIGFSDVTFALTSNPSNLLTQYSMLEGTRAKTNISIS